MKGKDFNSKSTLEEYDAWFEGLKNLHPDERKKELSDFLLTSFSCCSDRKRLERLRLYSSEMLELREENKL